MILIQPMLLANQSSNSSIQLTEIEDLMAKDVCPSPSTSITQSPPPIGTISPQSPSDISLSSNQLLANKDTNTRTEGQTTTITPTQTQKDTVHTHSDDSMEELSVSSSVSMSQCRYCYCDILRKSSVSQCHCSGVLCRECLINELKLTHSRANSVLQCTVCKNDYNVRTEFTFKFGRDCNQFCIDSLVHCGLKDEQYLLDSVGGKIGFFLVILGINTWILSTSLLFAFPPNGCPIELYYMVSVFDFAVGVSTIWFIIKCRYLSPAFLCLMYLVRFLYILLGWIPSVNLFNIYTYHALNKNHISILSYFLSFSFIAAIVMCMCWTIDLKEQYKKYSKENGKLVLNTPMSDCKIEIDDLVCK